MGLGEAQLLGMVLALIVGLRHRQRTEGGITQLAVVVLCGQDDPGGSFIQRLWDTQSKKAAACECAESQIGEQTGST